MDRLCRALCTVHSISAQISQEESNVPKLKSCQGLTVLNYILLTVCKTIRHCLKKMKNRLRVYGQVVVLILYLEKKRGLFLDQSVKKIFISAKIKILVIKPCVGLFSFDRIRYLGQSESLEFLILRLKFRYSEKATKIGPSPTGFLTFLSSVKL